MADRRFRPWLAAVLSLVLTGLGHLYLRSWFRAIAWFGLLAGITYLYVPEAVVSAPLEAGLTEVAPAFVVVGLATVDAYLRARQLNADAAVADQERCPHCGRPTDPTLSFCHWCTAEFDSAASEGRDS